MNNQKTWWEEFKDSDWFIRILLVFPYVLVTYAICHFFAELLWGPL